MTIPPPKKSDLGVRTASAVVMLAVAGTALWLGGGVWTLFVAVVGVIVLREFYGLVRGFATGPAAVAMWLLFGIVYIGWASIMLATLRWVPLGLNVIMMLVLAVVATDVGAFLVGRTIGGPKIAPSISPSKTWSGLFGGMLGATAALALTFWISWKFSAIWPRADLDEVVTGLNTFYANSFAMPWFKVVIAGPVVAIIAQAGDFFESWMKRRAGVKDSGSLIPGHGGLFDRVDGLLAVLFVVGFVTLAGTIGKP